jgi:GNAT superfamily N-acetyltransferase
MTDVPDLRIATMSREEVRFAIGLAANEGWNPGLHDAETFHAADPEGFLIGFLGAEPIGCISAVRYPEDFGFIGLYIVVPAQRGRGYGIQLWNAAMQRLAGCNIGLDGVIEQQENYRGSGFRLAYSNIRFALDKAPAPSSTDGIVRLNEVAPGSIADYDRMAFPASRPAFLQAWTDQPDAAGVAAIAGDRLRGYGVIRKCVSGWKIGPLFADDAGVAEQIFLTLCGDRDDDASVYLDVPEVNGPAMQLARTHGMRKVFGTARMYTGAAPPIALDRVFGVTTFELG